MEVLTWIGNNIVLCLVIAFAALALVATAVKLFRKYSTWDDANSAVWDAIEEVINTLRKLTQDALHSLSESEVTETAGKVYDDVIAPSLLARFVTRDAFIGAVVTRWRMLVAVDRTAKQSVAALRPAVNSSK